MESCLLQADFPIEQLSEACSREKSIRQGHLSTLQSWWARRPLAVCRASVFAALCQPDSVAADPDLRDELARRFPGLPSVEGQLSAFVAEISSWEASGDLESLNFASRLLGAGRSGPVLVADTFAGGGSIPLEALRLGVDAYAGELNPIATSALRVAIEQLPASSVKWVDEYERIASEVAVALEEEADRLYGVHHNESALAYFWCRSYLCPSCSIEVPLLQSKWLAKGKRNRAVRLKLTKQGIGFDVYCPSSKQELADADAGTISGRSAECPACHSLVTTAFLQEYARDVKLGELMYARFFLRNGVRTYETATRQDRAIFDQACARKEDKLHPEVEHFELDRNGVRHLWAIQYGVRTTADIFNGRQLLALRTVSKHLQRYISRGDASPQKRLVGTLLALTFNRLLVYSNRHSWWQSNGEFPANIFVRQGIPMVWNYVEIPASSLGAGGWKSATQWIAKVARHIQQIPRKGRVHLGDASKADLADRSVDLVAIDPPYYDAITYAYLSDVFYPWMKALLSGWYPNDYNADRPERLEEAIVDRGHSIATATKTREHYEKKIRESALEAARILKPAARLLVMYGHKEPEAWGALLGPLMQVGFCPVVSWPVHTERKVKFRHGRINALSSSCIILFERSNSSKSRSVSWGELRAELKGFLSSPLERFLQSHLAGSDLFAALVAPAVAKFHEVEILTAEGTLSLDEFVGLLPSLAKELEEEYITRQIKQIKRRSFRKIMQQLQDADQRSLLGEVDFAFLGSIAESDSVAAAAFACVDGIRRGESVMSDELWTAMTQTQRREASLMMRMLAVSPRVEETLASAATAGLGRIAMGDIQRGQFHALPLREHQ